MSWSGNERRKRKIISQSMSERDLLIELHTTMDLHMEDYKETKKSHYTLKEKVSGLEVSTNKTIRNWMIIGFGAMGVLIAILETVK